MKNIEKPIKITVCRDGFMSIMSHENPKRLGAALPVYSTNTIHEAIHLIKKVSTLEVCNHGKKTGALIEPHAIGWSVDEDVINAIDNLAARIEKAEQEENYTPTDRDINFEK